MYTLKVIKKYIGVEDKDGIKRWFGETCVVDDYNRMVELVEKGYCKMISDSDVSTSKNNEKKSKKETKKEQKNENQTFEGINTGETTSTTDNTN